MSESNSDNKETKADDVVAKKPEVAKKAVAPKKATTPKKAAPKAKADVVTKKPKVAKKTTTPKKVVVSATEADAVIKTKSDSEVTAPAMTAEKKEEATSNNKYYAIAASVLVAVVLSVVATASFFQDEYESVVASMSSSFDEMTQDSDAAVSEPVLADNNVAVVSNDVAQVTDQIAQVNIAPGYGYQPFATRPAQNVNFNDLRQQRRAAYETSLLNSQARRAELAEVRTAKFKAMDQGRIERMKRIETLRTKTQVIRQEMRQKMQAAYDEFHAI